MTPAASVVLCVLDGFGVPGEPARDPRFEARMTNWQRLSGEWPLGRLRASGEAVGLPAGQMGNSEVGHLNLGAGFPVLQDLPRINRALADGSFFANPALTAAADHARDHGTRLHLMALLGPGGIHAIDDHLLGTVELAGRRGLGQAQVRLHVITDGRDTPPQSAGGFVRALESAIDGKATIATVAGRWWAMDRDQRWERVARAYQAVAHGAGAHAATAEEAIAAAHAADTGDEFIEPTVIGDFAGFAPNESFIHLNFRADRAREFCRALVAADFSEFDRGPRQAGLAVTTLTEYQDPTELPVAVAFPPTVVPSLAGYLADHKWRQLHVAETEKYAHVTYFFNGGREEPFAGEDRVLVPSRRDIPTYDLAPEMSAGPITDVVVEAIGSGSYPFILVNYANADMVGHTGVWEASVRAVEVLDGCIGRLADACARAGSVLVITGDHGNIEEVRDAAGQPQTQHTTADVPLLVIGVAVRGRPLANGSLADVAPTICGLLGLPPAPSMTGRDLLDPEAALGAVETG